MMGHSKDMADIARYREMLKQSLDIYGVSVAHVPGPITFITFFRSKATSQSRNIYNSSWSNYNGSERRWKPRDDNASRKRDGRRKSKHPRPRFTEYRKRIARGMPSLRLSTHMKREDVPI